MTGLNNHGAMSETLGLVRGVLSAGTISEAIDGLSENLAGLEKDYGKRRESLALGCHGFLVTRLVGGWSAPLGAPMRAATRSSTSVSQRL